MRHSSWAALALTLLAVGGVAAQRRVVAAGPHLWVTPAGEAGLATAEGHGEARGGWRALLAKPDKQQQSQPQPPSPQQSPQQQQQQQQPQPKQQPKQQPQPQQQQQSQQQQQQQQQPQEQPQEQPQPQQQWDPGHKRVKSYGSPDDKNLKWLRDQGALTSVSFDEKRIATVPQSFLGLSIDLSDIEGVAHPDYVGLVKHLTQFDTGPLYMRVGAYSADRLEKPWPASVYRALSQLHHATGTKFIVGVNLHAESPQLTQEQVRRSSQLLPAGSIVSFSVGNEPDMYSLAPRDGLPGSALPKKPNWLKDSWIPVSKRIYKAAAAAANWPRPLSGPDWSDSSMDPSKLQWWLNSVNPYLNMLTVHHYGGDVFKDRSIEDLLDDRRMSAKIYNIKALAQVARKNGGLPLRITEVATLSYGGVQGISDTAGAAVWALDTALELAYQGASGVHFHQVMTRGQNANYNAIAYDPANGRVRAKQPLYGYLMLQQALGGGADIIARRINHDCKVWVLKSNKDGELRFMILNKTDKKECGADISLSAGQMARFKDQAAADYLYAPRGLSERWFTSYSSSFFGEWGANRVNGAGRTVPVQRYKSFDKKGRLAGGGLAVQLTNGTIAALIRLPPAAGGGRGG